VILLDSNIIIYLSKKLISIDDVFFDEKKTYAISIITYMEILGYSFKSKEEENTIKKILDYLKILYINKDIADKVIELKKENHIKLPDAIICSTAILNHAILVTNDIRLKNIPKIQLKTIDI